MSDESQPPPPSLRLKPRLSASANQADPEAATIASQPEVRASIGSAGDVEPASPQTMKIRLRPRLNAERTDDASRAGDPPLLPPDEPPSPVTSPPRAPHLPVAPRPVVPEAFDPVSPIRLKPRSPKDGASVSGASNVADEAPPLAETNSSRFRAPDPAPPPTIPPAGALSPLAKGPALAEANVTPKTATPEPGRMKLRPADAVIGDSSLVGALPENLPAGEGPSASPGASTPVPVIKRTPPPFPVLATTPNRPPESRIPHLAAHTSSSRKSKGLPWVVILLGLAVGGGGAYFGWIHFRNAPAVPGPNAVAPSPVSPSAALNALASIPDQAIQKAQEALVSRQEGPPSLGDGPPAESDISKPLPPPPAPEVVSPPSVAGTTATTTVAPGLSASMPIAAAADASAAFREFVANAKVSGVAETRALINGRLVRAGEIIDPTFGIRFLGVDRETKQLIFQDFSGAQVGRRY